MATPFICTVWKIILLQMKQEEKDEKYKVCEADIENMNWKNIIIHNDIISERKKGEYGLVMRLKGCEKTALTIWTEMLIDGNIEEYFLER